MDPTIKLLCGFLRIVEIAFIVPLAEETGFAVIAALTYVLREIDQVKAGARGISPPCELGVKIWRFVY